MKIKLLLPLLFAGLGFLSSCTKEDASGCQDLVISNGSFADRNETISNLNYEDGIIEMTITYTKCSDVHDFDLVWDGGIDESLPVQASLVIVDNDDPEVCNAIGSDDYCYDIKPILDELKAGEEIILKFSATTETLRITK